MFESIFVLLLRGEESGLFILCQDRKYRIDLLSLTSSIFNLCSLRGLRPRRKLVKNWIPPMLNID